MQHQHHVRCRSVTNATNVQYIPSNMKNMTFLLWKCSNSISNSCWRNWHSWTYKLIISWMIQWILAWNKPHGSLRKFIKRFCFTYDRAGSQHGPISSSFTCAKSLFIPQFIQEWLTLLKWIYKMTNIYSRIIFIYLFYLWQTSSTPLTITFPFLMAKRWSWPLAN